VSTANDSLLERVKTSYERLAVVASNLNTASDSLGKAIGSLDDSLKQLNLGIPCWHSYADYEDPGGHCIRQYIGYVKVGNRWGIAISRVEGNSNAPEEFWKDEEWLFNDAPRQLRMEAVEHIPAMIEALIAKAEEAVEKIKNKTMEAQQLADALKPKSVERNGRPAQR
jgi:hypothetical protein